MSTAEVLAQAKAWAQVHVVELAQEIIEWQESGLLRDGLLRELGLMCKPLDERGYLRIAESIATREALKIVATGEQA